ncbi:MAG: site-2 protease family protein [Chloroflexi bacterium]|nr:site-2 protease family protein [Chloroflexota bacterium]
MLEAIRNFAIFVAVLGGLIFFHELGHFIAAIKLKVKVKEFGIGMPMPPRLLGTARDKQGKRRWFFGKPPADIDPDDVIYSLYWLLLGGFVRPAGEDDPNVPDGLAASSKRVRFTVLAAGPAANLLIGFIVFAIGYATGWPIYDNNVKISEVVSGTPAEAGGLRPGDTILTINDEAVTTNNNRLSEVVGQNLGVPVTLSIRRDGQTMNIQVTPRTEWPQGQGPMGVALDSGWQLVKHPWPQAFVLGVREVFYQISETIMMPVRIISQEIKASDVRFVSVVGLKSINDAAVDTAIEINAWFPILKFIGTITVALALTNLLPLPALDGGRIMFVLIEAVRGRRVEPMREGFVHVMGLAFLLALMVFLIINDIFNPIFPR